MWKVYITIFNEWLGRSEALQPSVLQRSVEATDKRSKEMFERFTCHMFVHIPTFLKRSEFVITDTELKLIAAAAMMGESRMPKNGYRTPAAIGIPAAL